MRFSSIRLRRSFGAVVLGAALLCGGATAAFAQPADPNYKAQVQDYQAKQQQYQAQQQVYQAQQAAHEDAQDAYRDKTAVYDAQRMRYEQQRRDYERGRDYYDAHYGSGAYDTFTKTITTKTYAPAGGGDIVTVRKEVIEH
jgi:outer membrane murein-binding lipoprotein Lpp